MDMIKGLIAGVLLFSSLAYSGEWKGDFEIAHLVLEGTDTQPWANISPVPNPQTSCSDNTFVTLPTSAELGKQALSVLMMATAANKKIKVYLDGCLGARPHVKHVWVIK